MTYVFSERYAAETTIFYKPASVLKLSENQVQALGSPVPYTPFKVISQSLSGLTKSDALLRQVVLDLSLQIPEPKVISPIWYVRLYNQAKDWLEDYGSDAWSIMKFGRVVSPDPVDKEIQKIRKGLKIINEDSYVFTLTTRAKTPAKATRIANDIAHRLADLLHLDDRLAADRQRDGIRNLVAEKLAEIAQIDEAIRDLFARNHVASLQSEADRVTASFQQLRLSRDDALAELGQQEARVASASDRLRQQAPAVAPVMPGLATGPGEQGPTLLRARTPARLTSDEYSRLSAERLATEVNVSGLRARAASYAESLATMDRRLATLAQVQAEYDVLAERLQAAKHDYGALRDALAEALVKIDDTRSELRVTSPATEIGVPVSPIKIYHVGLSAVVAGLLACGLAYVFSYFNIRFFLPRPRAGGSAPRPRAGTAAAAAAAGT